MAKFHLARWLHSLGRRPATPIRKRKAKQSLRLEELETRVTPASARWDGGGVSNSWTDPLNWVANIAPQPGDDLEFPAGANRLTNSNDFSNLAINSLTFSGGGYSITGQPLTLGSATSGSGFLITNAGASNNTIGFDIMLGGTAGNRQFFNIEGSGAELTINGRLLGTTGVELTKDGVGRLILSADNSGFTGPISIFEGKLNIRNARALGDNSNPTTIVSTTQESGQLQMRERRRRDHRAALHQRPRLGRPRRPAQRRRQQPAARGDPARQQLHHRRRRRLVDRPEHHQRPGRRTQHHQGRRRRGYLRPDQRPGHARQPDRQRVPRPHVRQPGHPVDSSLAAWATIRPRSTAPTTPWLAASPTGPARCGSSS